LKSKLCTAAGVLALALGCGSAFSAFAQVRPERLVSERQSAMKLQGKYLYSIIPMATGKIPYDAAIVARNVGYLTVLTQMPWDGFDPRTVEVKNTAALPAIYKDLATFNAKKEGMQAELGKLVAAVKSGNEATIKTQIVDTNKACNACHDLFRAKE
jgi:cytochrome c556